MDRQTSERAHRVRRVVSLLFSLTVFFYVLGYFNPIGTDISRPFYLSIAAGLFTSSVIVTVTELYLHR